MKLPKVKVARISKHKVKMNSPFRPQFSRDEPELLAGRVQGIKASSIEERFAKALDGRNAKYRFRYTLGAPRGLPGWMEVDFIVYKNGIWHPIEIDTQFTHRDKGRKDVLHDSKVLSELEKQGFAVFPKVTHIMGEDSLMTQKQAENKVRELLG